MQNITSRITSSLRGRRRAVLVLGACVAVAALGTTYAVSTSGSRQKTPAASSASVSSEQAETAGQQILQAEAAKIPQFRPEHNVRRDVTVKSCSVGQGDGWRMAGTVTNSGKDQRSFILVTDFVTNPGNTVQATEVIRTPRVEPGHSVAWSSTGGSATKPLMCLLRYAQAA